METFNQNVQTATIFLNTIFGGEDTRTGCKISILSLPQGQPRFFESAAQAANYGIMLDCKNHSNIYFNLGLFKAEPKNGRGKTDDIAGITCVWADIDIGTAGHSGKKKHAPDIDTAISIVRQCGVEPSIIVHSGHGLHIYWVLDQPWIFENDAERKAAGKFTKQWEITLRSYFEKQGFTIDTVADLTRILRLPGTTNRKGELLPVKILGINSTRYIMDGLRKHLVFTKPIGETELDGFKVDLAARPPEDKFNKLLQESEKFKSTWERTRNDLLDQSASNYDISLANLAARASWTDQEIIDLIVAWRRKHNEDLGKLQRPDYLPRTLEKVRASIQVKTYTLDDRGNAQRFVDQHRHKLRFCYKQNQWFAWDGIRWIANQAEAERCAKETTDQMDVIARKSVTTEDSKVAESFSKHAKKSRSRGSIEAMLRLAQSELGIAVEPEQFDSNPYLLNCLNGVLDLHTGELLAHNSDFLMTKLAPVEYDANATNSTWDSFLNKATNGKEGLDKFLRLIVGYSLTGDTSEEYLFFIHGQTATGKSTFIEAVKTTLGDYAKTADFESFVKHSGGSSTRNDIARLQGARLVVSNEVDQGKELAESVIKSLTGGDKITARFLYQEAFEFVPQCKLWLIANHKPRVNSDDSAMWRRIVVIPLDNEVPANERDPHVKATLRTPKIAGAAILAWAVKGCLEWQKQGRLQIPDCVKECTLQYREEMNPIKDFLKECCVVEPINKALFTPSNTLWETYGEWAKENSSQYLPQNKLGQHLKSLGLTSITKKIEGKVIRGWLGVKLILENRRNSESNTTA